MCLTAINLARHSTSHPLNDITLHNVMLEVRKLPSAQHVLKLIVDMLQNRKFENLFVCQGISRLLTGIFEIPLLSPSTDLFFFVESKCGLSLELIIFSEKMVEFPTELAFH